MRSTSKLDTSADQREVTTERRLLVATFVTMLGNNIQLIAASLLTYRQVDSAMAVGLVYIAAAAPQALLTPVLGRVADRFDRRSLCVISDVVSAVGAAALPVYLMLGGSGEWGAYVTTLVLAVCQALFVPASAGLMKERVPLERLTHFNASYETAFQSGALVSGVFGGLAAQWVGLQPLFYLNAVTFVCSAVLLAGLGRRRPAVLAHNETLDEAPDHSAGDPTIPVVRLGLFYALGSVIVTVANTLILVAVVSKFHQGPGLLGIVDAFAITGMLIGIAMYKRYLATRDPRKVMVYGYLVCALLAFVQPLSILTLTVGVCLAGLTYALGRVSSRVELLKGVDERRVSAVFGLVNAAGLGASILGTLTIALMADHVGVNAAFATLAIAGAVVTVVVGATFHLRSMRWENPNASQPAKETPSDVLAP